MKPEDNGVQPFNLPEPTLQAQNTPTPNLTNGPEIASVPQPPTLPTASDDQEDALTNLSMERAKAIIAQTSTDPYQQSEQLNKLKAEYSKQRFNIDIKLAQN